MMSDKQLLARWKKIKNPKMALLEICEHEDFLGYDPYYKDLREALLDMAERIGGEKDGPRESPRRPPGRYRHAKT
jgi:hypothetical protein